MNRKTDKLDDRTRESLESLSLLWENLGDVDYRDDDILANIIEDDEDYVDEYFDPDEFE